MNEHEKQVNVSDQIGEHQTKHRIELGWRVDNDWRPIYWLDDRAAVGNHATEHLVTIPAELIARHGIIIAQSGSGKSYFLGRLVEEILLKTKARVVILDPNADFRAVSNLKASTRDGEGEQYPTEQISSYRTHWSQIEKSIFRADSSDFDQNTKNMELWWPNVNIDVVAQELSLIERSEFAHCHQFVGLMARLLDPSKSLPVHDGLGQLLDHCEELFFHTKQEEAEDGDHPIESTMEKIRNLLRLHGSREKYIALQNALRPIRYVSADTGRFYFSRARYFQQTGLLSNRPHADDYAKRRLSVVDLPSIQDPDAKNLAMSSTLNLVWRVARSEWASALMAPREDDKRVPTFVVVDEAHNLIPAEPRSAAAAAIREQFRTIAAEGRKYGVFLLVATQRPDRLDPLILSEFENKVIMRISSAQVIQTIVSQLGLTPDETSMLSVVPTLGTGRGLLFGRWSNFLPVRFATAARRTVEGGRNLRDEYWTLN